MIATKNREPMERFQAYVTGVTSGRLVVCDLVKKAVARHLKDLEKPTSWGYYFDPQAATDAIEFLECLKHSKGKWGRAGGEYLYLEPWQCFMIGSIFGWRRTIDGGRRFRVAFIEVARKNGKSTIAAGVGLKLFAADNEPGAEVYSTATSRAQAKIVHEEAKRMCKKADILREFVRILRDHLFIDDSKYEPLGAAEDNLDGLNVHGAIVDELHAHKTRGVFDVMDTGTGSRENPLLLMITTAGDGGNTESICWEQHGYTEKILNGIFEDDTFFGLIFALDVGDDWTDEDNWIKANPNLDVSVSRSDLRAKVNKAKNVPSAAMAIRQKHFNEWVGSRAAWLAMDLWEQNRGGVDWYTPDGLTEEALDLFAGRECYLGCDFSSVNDLTAIVASFPRDDGGVDVLAFGFVPRDNAIGFDRDRKTPYVSYAEEGYLELTPTKSIDYDRIIEFIVSLRDDWAFDIQEIACDPANAHYILTRLDDEFGEEAVIKHRQTFMAMNDPIKSTQKLLTDGRLRHGGNRALAWCVSNVVVRKDSQDNVRFDKNLSSEKIDLAVALVMSVGRAIAAGGLDESSVYDQRGAIYV